MKFVAAAFSTAALGLAFATGAYADTRNSNDKATMEQKASPAAPSTGSSAPVSHAEKEQAFRRIDMDGDGSLSKAEAAGNGKLMTEFDAADKDHDGKLSRAEYDSIGSKPEAKAKTKTPHKVKAQAN